MKSVAFSRVHLAQNTEFLVAHKVHPASHTNEFGLGNYPSYRCTKLSENRWKFGAATVDERENFVTAEVGYRTCTLNSSVRVLNGQVSGKLICEDMFPMQMW